ncbi:anthranilate phosphoribosyltransferase [Tindallia magadiensis]|uniref:Anthranilate phosphoribosyltransferase n=1 Tax=Tindallia magadiensis TaxID=69895 RepID=A0A1I3AZR1_9FIRM|nr:anthranilate phosphoribosyltransferase [Tindallia magadiensis]SFH55533.1 anthranilate phosphoribosyltransferase [Tindallia magadiensis]
MKSLAPMIEKLMSNQSLTSEEMIESMEAIMDGNVNEIQMAAFLTALRHKGESVNELVAAAKTMRNRAKTLPYSCVEAVDTCGTGGDGGKTFNVSTASAIVAAAGGAKVLKHGNRSVSSNSGSADVLEVMGINIHQEPDEAMGKLHRHGMAFLYAPDYHASMKNVANVRKTLGFRSIFNLLGPLANPGSVKYQVMGVYSESLVRRMAETLKALGTTHAMVVHGSDGMDELTVTGDSYVCEIKDGKLQEYRIKPQELGLELVDPKELEGKGAKENAAIILSVLQGKRNGNRSIVILNAGAVLYVAGVARNMQEGVLKAAEIIDDGRAFDFYELIRSNKEKVENRAC